MGTPSHVLRALAERLAQGPAILLLGQRSQPDGFEVPLPREVADYAWNAVVTSRTDASLSSEFAAAWRTVVPCGLVEGPLARNPQELRLQHLAGRVGDPGNPVSVGPEQEEDRRYDVSVALRSLLTHTLTPRGTLIIDGWTPGDWVSAEMLMQPVKRLGPAQAHLFGSTADTERQPHVAAAIASGALIPHRVPLSEALASLGEQGALLPGETSATGGAHVVALGDGFATVDPHAWNDVRRSARPLDLALLQPPPISSTASRYHMLREFLGAPEGTVHWGALSLGLPFRRAFQDTLAKRVKASLDSREFPGTVILAGQTAVGKSVALAMLASGYARSGKAAVLHLSWRSDRPEWEHIDSYAQWVEAHGDVPLIFVWDGMLPPAQYEGMAARLRSRGRRVLIVGSTYHSEVLPSDVVRAPAQLTAPERQGLANWLGSYGIPWRQAGPVDANFLAFLYRALPETEYQLRRGLSRELRAAERELAEANAHALQVAKQSRSSETRAPLTALAEALSRAGIGLAISEGDSGDESTLRGVSPVGAPEAGESEAVRRLTTFVLTAGRFGLSVPIDLAMRLAGGAGDAAVRDAVRHFDIIRWVDDDKGEYALVARTRLEARLVAQQERTTAEEVAILCDAIRVARVTDGWMTGVSELNYLVSLLEAIGPAQRGSEVVKGFDQHFLEIAEALREVRERAGAGARLALQESVFRRGYVHWSQRSGADSPDERMALLDENLQVVRDAGADTSVRSQLRLQLHVEEAATLGAMLHEQAQSGSSASALAKVRLSDLRAAGEDARSIDTDSAHPVDVLAWATLDALKCGVSEEDKLTLVMDALASIDSLDGAPLRPDQRAELQNKTVQLTKVLGDAAAIQQAMEELAANADPAATYYLCRLEQQELPAGPTKALEHLRNSPAAVRQDWRCAQLYLELAWREATGVRLLDGDRVPLALTEDAWEDLLIVASEVSRVDAPARYRAQFVAAMAHFHLRQYDLAASLFREVADVTTYHQRRIFTAYLMADSEGSPRVFSGVIRRVSRKQGTVLVTELGAEVDFRVDAFPSTADARPYQPLPSFHVGFSLLGPIADPRRYSYGQE